MDAPCEIQGSIHVFRLVNNMCPGKWVHIRAYAFLFTYVLFIYLCAFYLKAPNKSAMLGRLINAFTKIEPSTAGIV